MVDRGLLVDRRGTRPGRSARFARFTETSKDALHTCAGDCGEPKPASAFPTVPGMPGVRVVECRRCRDRRKANRRPTTTTGLRSDHVGDTIRRLLEEMGPMTVQDVASATRFQMNEIKLFWPPELAAMQLRQSRESSAAWSDETMLDALREAALYAFPLTSGTYRELRAVGQVRGPSVGKLRQRFGSWSKACEAAGVVPGESRRSNHESKWTDYDILQLIRQYFSVAPSGGSSGGYDEWRGVNAPDGPTATSIHMRFGSWNEAKRRALSREVEHHE